MNTLKIQLWIKSAGSFDALMLQKQALKRQGGMKYISLITTKKSTNKVPDGAYENLRPMYDTEMPYVFWVIYMQCL